MFYPLTFRPIFQERIWGGRNLETLYRKQLPAQVPIGESWEVSDRDEAQSIVTNGPLAGMSLHDLMRQHRTELLGEAKDQKGRFPLLVKILDAQDKLSLQVHPPKDKAETLGGEPKTEMWFITRAEPHAELYVGLRKGATRPEFETKIKNGTVAECFHRVLVKTGDTMFLPSGRVHAIGAGLVIFEIQQNSDTTYRVFDWNRTDTKGNPRQLHVNESLQSIDFSDFEPAIIPADSTTALQSNVHIQSLVNDPLFQVELVTTSKAAHIDYSLRSARVIGVAEGTIRIKHEVHAVTLHPGEFALLPSAIQRAKIDSHGPARFLVAQPR